MSRNSERSATRQSSGEESEGTSRQSWLIPALLGLGGVLVGVIASVGTTTLTLHDQHSETRREQRREAYASLYAAVASYLSEIGVQSQVILEARANPRGREQAMKSADEALDKQDEEIFRSQAVLVLTANKSVSDAAFDLSTRARAMRAALTAPDLTKQTIDQQIDVMSRALDRYAVDARQDLGVAP
ncbi:hypothetical protein [Motilibacter aurantiacus]|uniref:hypothetical protein n=1 Tax=Motilibacter aurantiacus TaxID=2714955 RepID=UPI00140E421F|nr:hypothetical protein [Motilibacter aurantiacus]NHC43648.1 hypothetical protein [Motilibacter aurantiacus]